MGVARASVGSGLMRATLGLVKRVGKELMETGSYASLLDGAIQYAEVNGLMGR
jgi:2-methylisocitrate lyase-like PEP mutase family enzyme